MPFSLSLKLSLKYLIKFSTEFLQEEHRLTLLRKKNHIEKKTFLWNYLECLEKESTEEEGKKMETTHFWKGVTGIISWKNILCPYSQTSLPSCSISCGGMWLMHHAHAWKKMILNTSIISGGTLSPSMKMYTVRTGFKKCQ